MDQNALAQAYRPVRRLAPPGAPFMAVLAADGDDMAMLVATSTLPPGWPGWRRGSEGHLLAPLDIARTADGHDVVLPWCRERLDRYLRRRTPGGLHGGEVVTLLVCLLRAARAECVDRRPTDAGATGVWWLSDAGRPLFCEGTGEPIGHACAQTARILAELTEDRVVVRLAGECADALQAGEVRVVDLERRLFAACAPRALTDLTEAGEGMLDDAREHPWPSVRPATSRRTQDAGWHAIAARAREGGLIDAVRARLSALVRRLRSSRRAPILVGAVAAAAVLLGGLLWPTGASTESAPQLIVTGSRLVTSSGGTAGGG